MIIFTREQVDKLLAHASREYPNEACGVLAGMRKGNRSVVAIVYECTNLDPDPDVGYEIDPIELLEAMADAEMKGFEIIGFYHSHPMPLLRPSVVDESKATWPGHSYVIVSPRASQQITSWRWEEDKGFEMEEVVVK
jgi:proteasome lid subunit RPN8/RPN11